MMVTASVEQAGKPNNVHELQRVTVRLLDQSAERFDEEVLVADTAAELTPTTSDDDLSEQINALQRTRAVKKKARGGNLEKSVKDTRNTYDINESDSGGKFASDAARKGAGGVNARYLTTRTSCFLKQKEGKKDTRLALERV